MFEFSVDKAVSLCPEPPLVIVICGTPAACAADTAAAMAAVAACAILLFVSTMNCSAIALTRNDN